jgi:7-carboxy-7-deazaguanine synthase
MDQVQIQEVTQGKALPLMEAFYTLQGEGFHKGSAAYFIRIGGCDVGCHWCDVKESWDAQKHPPTEVDVIVKEACRFSDTIVVTGGEPLMWNMEPLTSALQAVGMKIHIETSGAYPISGHWDWFCLSPKKNKLPTIEAVAQADELKVIIYNKDDFRFAEEQAKRVGNNCVLYLQPEWSRREQMMPLMVDYVLKNPHWKVSLQTHKYLKIP